MSVPMTRRALRRRVNGGIAELLVLWLNNNAGVIPFPRSLKRAGFAPLPERLCGIERNVIVGPGVIVKTTGWSDTTHCSRRSKYLAPAILIAENVIVQPLGRVLGRLSKREKDRLWGKFERARDHVSRVFQIGDDHEWNYAVFPDRTVRCIDY